MLARTHGFKWIGVTLPRNNKIKTRWKCLKCEYEWEAKYNSIQQGYGCPYCAGHVKKIKSDYYKLAESRRFKWVGKVLPKNIQTKTWWECIKCGYKWEARYNDIYNGNGCPSCSGRLCKTEKDYYELAKNRGFKWIGPFPRTTGCKTWWECKREHRWQAKYNKIQQGEGCPVCIRISDIEYYNVGRSRGIFWVGIVLPKNVLTKTLWKCEKCGYGWKTSYASIQQGSGCPHCKNLINGVPVSRPQIKLSNLLYGSLNYPEGRYRIDIAIVRRSQKIAVEYDAQYWHEGREEQDIKRDKYLISKGWKILHIKSGCLLPTQKQLKTFISCLLEKDNKVCNLYLKDWKL